MTEIQLQRIMDRTNQAEGSQLSDGDELMIKNGVSISKFSKKAMGLGKDCKRYKLLSICEATHVVNNAP